MKIGGQIDVEKENTIFNEITQDQKDQSYSVLSCLFSAAMIKAAD